MGFFKSAFADLNNYTRGFFGSATPLEDVNPEFRRFTDLSVEDENVMRRSLIEQFFKESDKSPYQVSGYDITSYTNFIYGAIATEKPARLKGYRTMAEFPEVAGAIDEICDSMMCYDEDGNLMNLIVKNEKNLTGTKEIEIRKQFTQYLSLFSMDYNFYDFCRTFIIEGQLSWENVVGDDPTDGIIGINYIPNDFYDFLIDQNGNKKGIIVKTPKILRSQANQVQMQGNIQLMDPSAYGKMKNPDSNKENKIAIVAAEGLPLPFDQITYVDSGLYTADKMIVFPILEKSRKAYRQLTLIEDSILIYRLVRAPERLVFNVATGKLPMNRAVQEVYKIMKRYQTKKFYNPSTGGVSNDYDPHQMSENLWFPRPEGTEGTSVTTIGGNVNWTQLPDLDYFLKKLYISLKVPFDRFQTATNSIEIKRADTITAEEYRFAKFIMRLQNQFSRGFKHGFITHLKLIGLWDRYELNEEDFKVSLTPPAQFELYEQQRLLKIKYENYSIVTKENVEMSKEIAMKDCLGFTEDDIKENNDRLEIERLRMATLERKVEAIKTTGNPYATAAP